MMKVTILAFVLIAGVVNYRWAHALTQTRTDTRTHAITHVHALGQIMDLKTWYVGNSKNRSLPHAVFVCLIDYTAYLAQNTVYFLFI